uniref:Uncharacterized protein n=1 Tax=Oryza barthii TaxID=65489 RepID=A0A0D3FT57_9ORYZ
MGAAPRAAGLLEFGLVGAEDVDEGYTILGHLLELALGAVEVQAPTEATRAGVRITLGAAEDEEEASEGKEGEEEVAYEGEEFAQARGVTLDDGDVDVVGGEDVNKVRGVGDDNGGVMTVDGSKLQYSGGVDVDVDGSVHYPHAPLHATATRPTTASRA